MTALWHPFANMADVDGHEFVIDRADGSWLWTEDGQRVLDGTAALWYANVGHGRDEIREAVDAQMRRLDAYSIFGDYANRPALDLAERLAELAPFEGGKVFFTTGGGEAIDTAAKLARRYWRERGNPERTLLVSRVNGYHGTNGFGTSIGGIEDNVTGWGRLIPDVGLVPYDSAEALEEHITRVGSEQVAAFFVEPVIGAGGVFPPPPGYIESVAEVCRRHDVLLIADAVICGFGRLGNWFGIERWEVEPDIVVFAKGVTSGYLPLGGVIASESVAEPFFEDGGALFRHGPTYSGHPTCCAAALANLDIIEKEGLLERALEVERWLADALGTFESHPAVAEVRSGCGVLGAVQLQPDHVASGGVARVAGTAREKGVLVRPLLAGIALSPPLVIEQSEVELIAEAVAAGLDSL